MLKCNPSLSLHFIIRVIKSRYLKPKYVVILTLTKSFFLPKPNQTISTQQERNKVLNINKRKVAYLWFAENMYPAKMYVVLWHFKWATAVV